MLRIRKIFNIALIILLLLFSLAFIMLQSPLNPAATSEPNYDSCVYLYIGEHMADGIVPYLDVFEQKGPLIFFINYIGILVGGETGVWAMQILSMSIAMLFCFLVGKKYSNYIVSACATSVIFIFLQLFYETGNFTEEYALPFIFIALYLFLEYLDKNKFEFSNIKLSLIGFTLGCVLMLRPNMIALWIVFCGYIVIHSIVKKEYKFLLRCIAFSILGVVVAVLPFIIYLGLNSALTSFIDQYWFFNLRYSETTWGARIRVAVIFVKPIISLISLSFYVLTTIFEKNKNRKLVYALLFLYSLVNIGLLSMSGRPYFHYAMISLPTFIVPISIIFISVYSWVENMSLNRSCILNFSKVPILVIATLIISINSIYDGLGIIKNTKNDGRSGPIMAGEIIKENTEKDDKITVLGYDCIVFLHADRLSSSKYIYQYPISDVSESIKYEYLEHLIIDSPKIIVATHKIEISSYMPEKYYEYITKNYSMIGTAKEYHIYKLND